MTTPASFTSRVHACAALFRLGRDVEGVTVMVGLFDEAMPLLAGRSMAQQADCAAMLSEMLACQQAQNWLGLADWLEYEWLGLVSGQ